MKLYLSIISLFCVAQLSAQTYRNECVAVATDPVRSCITPYASEEAAMHAGQTPYVVKLPNMAADTKNAFESKFPMGISWLNRQVLVRVGYCSSAYELVLNGKVVGYEQCGALPTEFNVTKQVQNGRNTVAIRPVRNTGVAALDGRTPDFEVKNAEVVCQPTIRIRDIVCRTRMNSAGDGVAEIGIVVKCDALNQKRIKLYYNLLQGDTLSIAKGTRELQLNMRREDTLRFVATIPRKMLWSADHPTQYRLTLKGQIEGRYAEYVSRKIGFRTLNVLDDGVLRVNGQPVKLSVTDYYGFRKIDHLKSSGYNAVRLHDSALSRNMLDACDSLGMYVISESAIATAALPRTILRGGNPSNDPQWNNAYLARARACFNFAQSHPSVVALSLADGLTTGVNIYDAYLLLKQLETERPVLYFGAGGEWCTDTVKDISR